MDQECLICRFTYDNQKHYPMILCQQQHLCCQLCLENLIKTSKRCPECRQSISKETVIKFRLYFACNDKIQKQKKSLEQEYKNIMINDFSFEKNMTNEQFHQFYKNKAVGFIRSKSYQMATQYLKNAIQKQLETKCSFDEVLLGMGSRQQQRNYYKELTIDQWISKHQLKNISLFDLLSYAILRNQHAKYEQKQEWYSKMIKKYKRNYQLMFGLALVLHNHDHLQAALDQYSKIITLKPSFDKSYQMKAMIFLCKKDIKQSNQFSQQCLKRNPANIYAQCISIQSQGEKKNIQKTKEKLKEMIAKEPEFVRPYYILGIFLAYEKKQSQAFHIFQQCLNKNSKFLLSSIKLAYYYYISGNSKLSITIVISLLRQQLTFYEKRESLIILLKSYCYQNDLKNLIFYSEKLLQIQPQNRQCFLYLGITYLNQFKYNEALNYFIKYQQKYYIKNIYEKILKCYEAQSRQLEMLPWLEKWSKRQPEMTKITLLFADTYFKLKRFNDAIPYYEQCLQKQYEERYCLMKIIQVHRQRGEEIQAVRRLGELITRCDLTPTEVSNILKFGESLEISTKKVKLI